MPWFFRQLKRSARGFPPVNQGKRLIRRLIHGIFFCGRLLIAGGHSGAYVLAIENAFLDLLQSKSDQSKAVFL
jgi:hypothetical protein